MAINLKSEHADRLARELAALTGESLTDAVTIAIDQRLTRERAQRQQQRRRSAMERIAAHFRELPVYDDRPASEIPGYDECGLPT